MDIVLNALNRRVRVLGWGALLPLVMLVSTVYWGVRPWTVLVIAVAGSVAVLAPSVAGGLAAITLIGLPRPLTPRRAEPGRLPVSAMLTSHDGHIQWPVRGCRGRSRGRIGVMKRA